MNKHHNLHRHLYQLSVCLLMTASFAFNSEAKDDVEFHGSLIWQNYGTSTIVNRKNLQNENNLNAKIPIYRFDSRLLPNFQLRSNSFKLIFRPIATQTWSQTQYELEKPAKSGLKSDAFVNEAYGQWSASDSVILAYGIQNFQWGPTESISPTNKIFNESILSKDSFYEPSGKYLTRLNLSAGKHLNIIFLTEVDKTDQWQERRASETFETTSMVKAEANWSGGASYFGMVGGTHESGNPWFGEYFNLDLFGGFSIFGDVSHERHARIWLPKKEKVAGGPATEYELVQFEQTYLNKDPLKTVGVGGIKYAFEGGSTLQLEYIANQLGMTEEQRLDAFKSIDPKLPQQAPYLLLNSYRFAKTGSILPGMKYAYGSLRVPDFFTLKDLLFYMRYLHSLTDQSNYSMLVFEYGLSDSGTIVFSQSAFAGKAKTELEGFVRNSTTIGYKHAW